MQPDVRQQQPHQPEYPIELLIHRVMHGLQHGIVVFETFLERAEHLIRAVMPGDLGGEQQIDGRRIEGHFRMERPQLVERGDDAVPQRDVSLQQAADQRLLGLRGADADEHGRKLAPDVLRRVLVAQACFDFGDDVVAVTRQRVRRVVDELRSTERLRSAAATSSSRVRPSRLGSPAARRRSFSSRMQGHEQVEERSGTSAISRAASARSRDAVGARDLDHRLEERARRVEILRRSGRGEKRRHPGAD